MTFTQRKVGLEFFKSCSIKQFFETHFMTASKEMTNVTQFPFS